MKNLNFYIIGSSNAIRIEHERPKHPAFQRANIFNRATAGANAILADDQCFVRQCHSNPKPDDLLIISVGTNHFQNNEYHHYRQAFRECINYLIEGKQWPAPRISIILALPRGNDIYLQLEQMDQMEALKRDLEMINVKSYSVYDELPPYLKNPINLFSRKSYSEEKYVHYAREVRRITHDVIAEIITHKIRFRMRIGYIAIE